MILPEIKWKLDLMSHVLNVPHAEISRKLGLTAARTWTLEDCVYLPDEQRHSGWDYYVERSGVKSIEKVFAAL